MDPEQISIWISERRFAPFLERAEGERAVAVELYLWQARVAGASLTTLAHFEVLLRNAVDRCLAADAPETPVEDTWLFDPATLSAQGMGRVREILGRLEKEGYPRERSRVIAGLPFSFWKGLFARRYEELWRNRIAHHDSLLDQNLGRRLEEMVGVANAIDSACGEWLTTHTEMTALVAQRPVSE